MLSTAPDMEVSRMAQHRLKSRILTTAFASAIAVTSAKAHDTADGLKVHEWGTFHIHRWN
jgi:hypothetical protein